jgi:hypothetical protein
MRERGRFAEQDASLCDSLPRRNDPVLSKALGPHLPGQEGESSNSDSGVTYENGGEGIRTLDLRIAKPQKPGRRKPGKPLGYSNLARYTAIRKVSHLIAFVRVQRQYYHVEVVLYREVVRGQP